MSDAALSQEELAALRDAGRSLGADAGLDKGPSQTASGAPKGDPAASPRPVRLADPERQAARRMPALNERLPLILKRQRQVVGTTMRQTIDVSLEPPAITPMHAMQETVAGWLWGAVIELADSKEPIGWVGLSLPLGLHLIEVAFGGTPGEPGNLIEKRQLTRIEQEILLPFLRQIAGAVGDELHFDRLGTLNIVPLKSPMALTGQRTEEAGILLRHLVPIKSGALAYELLLLPKALEELGAGPRLVRAEARRLASESLHTHALAAEVEVVANLGSVEVSVASLAALKPGQIFWLEHNQAEPIALFIEGQAKFTAMPMQRAGAVGVAILESLS